MRDAKKQDLAWSDKYASELLILISGSVIISLIAAIVWLMSPITVNQIKSLQGCSMKTVKQNIEQGIVVSNYRYLDIEFVCFQSDASERRLSEQRKAFKDHED